MMIGGIDSVAIVAGLVIFSHCVMFPMFMYGAMLMSHGGSKKPKERSQEELAAEAEAKRAKAATKVAAAAAVTVEAKNGTGANKVSGKPKKAEAKSLWQPQGETDDVFMTAYDFEKEDEAVRAYAAQEGAWFGETEGEAYPWKQRGRRNTSSHSAAVSVVDSDAADDRQVVTAGSKGNETEHIRLMCELVGHDELGPEVTFAARKVVMEFLSREIDEQVVEFDSDDED